MRSLHVRHGATYAFLALERLAVHRIEKWLAVLHEKGALAPGTLEHQARFLQTVVNGLLTERALPGDQARLKFEAHTLATAASAVLRLAPLTDKAVSAGDDA